MRRTEVVARAQQFYSGEIGPDGAAAWGLPGANTREADFGVNYFLRDGMKGIVSCGRQFSSAGKESLPAACVPRAEAPGRAKCSITD